MKAPQVTEAQRRALSLLPLDNFGRTIYGVRITTLRRLQAEGLARFRPYGKPPTWATTHAGRQVLKASQRRRAKT